MFNDGELLTVIIAIALVSAVGGWAVIELTLWLLSFVSIGFGR